MTLWNDFDSLYIELELLSRKAGSTPLLTVAEGPPPPSPVKKKTPSKSQLGSFSGPGHVSPGAAAAGDGAAAEDASAPSEEEEGEDEEEEGSEDEGEDWEML